MILFLMHIKYKNSLFWSRWGKKKSFSSTSDLMQWNPKVCWIHLFNSCTAYTFSSATHLWNRHLQSHPPFSLLWSQRRQIPLTSSFLFLPLFCPVSLSQLSDVLCSLSLSSHLFFLSVEKGRCGSMSSWGPGTPSVWRARAASSPNSLPGPGPFSAPVFFPGMWTRTA